MMKLSLDERRRRRKAEKQRQLKEESERAEQEYQAEAAAAAAAAAAAEASSRQEEEEEEPPKKKKKKTLLERSTGLFSNHTNNKNKNHHHHHQESSSALREHKRRIGWNRPQQQQQPAKKKAAYSFLADYDDNDDDASSSRKNRNVANAAATTPKRGAGLLSKRSFAQDSTGQKIPFVSGSRLLGCVDASPQSSVSMSQPSPTETTERSAAAAAAAACSAPAISKKKATVQKYKQYDDSNSTDDSTPDQYSTSKRATGFGSKSNKNHTPVAMGKAAARDEPQKNEAARGENVNETTKGGNAASRSRSDSESSSSGDELRNNLLLFQQMQQEAAAKKAAKDAAAAKANEKEETIESDRRAETSTTAPEFGTPKDATAAASESRRDEEINPSTSEDPNASTAETPGSPDTKKTPSTPVASPTSSRSQKSTPRNPLARMKEEARQQLARRTLKPPTMNNNADLARQLDEDDDDDDLPAVDSDDSSSSGGPKTKKKRKKKKEKEPKKRKNAPGTFSWNTTTVTVDGLEGIEGRDEDELSKELKPDFRENQVLFEPHPLEPLRLEMETDDDARQHEYVVPASMARYMYGFQHDGIRFLFNSIMTHRGAILGDDMGLGKTIQTIGLLAALLGKTGTGADLVELHRRAQKSQGIKSEFEKAKQEALQSGDLFQPVSQNPTMSAQLEWCPVLILAPAAVLASWIKAFKVWGHFSVALYQPADKKSAIENIKLGAVEILVASHHRIQADEPLSHLLEIPWKLVIVDEFHIMKNEDTCKAQNLRELRDKHPETILVGLSGTCMQNNHEELWNLFDIISKGFLGEKKVFMNMISKPIMKGRTKDASPQVVELGRTTSEQLSSRLYQILLERKKEEVLKDKLPEKDERIVFCELSPLQKKIYKHILDQPDFMILKQYYMPCDCGSNQHFFNELQQLSTREERIEYQRRHKDEILKRGKCCFVVPYTFRRSGVIDPRAVIWRRQHEGDLACEYCPYCISLAAMNVLIKLCSHVGLLQPKSHPDTCAPDSFEWREATKKLEQAKVFIPKEVINRELPSYVLEDSIMSKHFELSGKMKVLARLLKGIDRVGGRVLIFSAFTQTLDLIQNYVTTSGYSFLRMDGTTPTHKRQDLADEFNTNSGILLFLLSTKAMGLGINLTSANFVIIFDVEWNPSWDSQAQDRSYRIGQKRDVTVFRLVSQGTLEEQKYLRQVYKTQLKKETMVDVDDPERSKAARTFRGVAKDRYRRGEIFGLANLFRFEDGTMMKYGAEAKEAGQFGRGIYNMESVMEAAKKSATETDDEDFEDLLGSGNIGVADLAQRSEKNEEDKGENESDSEESMIGAESQFAADVCVDGSGAFASNDYNTGPMADSVPSLTTHGALPDSVPSLSPNGGTTGSDAAVPDGVPSSAAGAAAREVVSGVVPMAVNSASLKHEKEDSAPLGKCTKPHENSSVVKSEAGATTHAGAGATAAPMAADTTLPDDIPSSAVHNAAAQEAGDESSS